MPKMKSIPFVGGLTPVKASTPVGRPVNLSWVTGDNFISTSDRQAMLADANTHGHRKHHKTAQQRARQLAKTQYIKGAPGKSK